jgi:hypothetical protein
VFHPERRYLLLVWPKYRVGNGDDSADAFFNGGLKGILQIGIRALYL